MGSFKYTASFYNIPGKQLWKYWMPAPQSNSFNFLANVIIWDILNKHVFFKISMLFLF